MKNLEIKITKEKNGLVTKEFAKQAKIFGTPEYKLWREFEKEYEGAKMVTKSIKKNTKKDTYRKNMTYNNMRQYISIKPNSEENLKQFEDCIIESKIKPCPYSYVANWFKSKFPDYKDNSVFQDTETSAA